VVCKKVNGMNVESCYHDDAVYNYWPTLYTAYKCTVGVYMWCVKRWTEWT